MRKFVAIFSLLLVFNLGHSQVSDSLRSSLRNMDWPLTVFKGQMRADLNFSMGIAGSRFDFDRNRTDLDTEGNTFTEFDYGLNIRYGIANFLELSAVIQHENIIQRMRPVTLVSALGNQLISYTSQQKGFDNILLRARVKYPSTLEKYDLVLTGGISIPFAGQGNQEPQHSFDQGSSFDEIYYYSMNKPGFNSLGLHWGGSFKYRFEKMAVEINYSQVLPLSESEGSYWNYVFNGSSFSYTENTYTYFSPVLLEIEALLEYQIAPYFSGYVGTRIKGSDNGWEQLLEKKVALPSQSESRIILGVNLIANTSIWYRQELDIIVTGKNIIAPFRINSVLTFNRF